MHNFFLPLSDYIYGKRRTGRRTCRNYKGSLGLTLKMTLVHNTVIKIKQKTKKNHFMVSGLSSFYIKFYLQVILK